MGKEISKCKICNNDFEKGVNITDDVKICNRCIIRLANASKAAEEKEVIKSDKVLLPEVIYEQLNNYIIGQDSAKKTLSYVSYLHMLRVNHNERCKKNGNYDDIIDKSNVMVIGSTGVGKTETIRQLSRILDVPVAIVDATTYTASGYVGEDVESMLNILLAEAEGDIRRAEKGIIFVDEFDKLAEKNTISAGDIGGTRVQQGMLKLIEGKTVQLESHTETSLGIETLSEQMDTSDILFILGGSFEGIEKIINNNRDLNIGFNKDVSPKKSETDSFDSEDVKMEHFKKFGIIPEILGRAPIVCKFNNLEVEDMKKILVEPKNSLLKQINKIFKLSNVNVDITEDAQDAIAQQAYDLKIGARALKTVTNDLLKEVLFRLPIDSSKTITIDEDFINGNGDIKIE